MTILTADWLTQTPVQAVFEALETQGHRTLFVGGCVRNTLLCKPVTDIDVATDARPEQTIAALEAAGLKALPTGIDHGTITAVSSGQAIEITTFRRDVATDGRRATVAYSDQIEEDAARRDFTMNALYATSLGEVLDPIGGLPDLQASRLRFIGDPDQRIAEDYLRIMRFFRFQAWYADPALGIDSEGLAACASAADGLSRVSAERIWAELVKLLAAPDPAPALSAMAQAGILGVVVPGGDARAVAPLVYLEQSIATHPQPIRRLAALGLAADTDNLRMSRSQARKLATLRASVSAGMPIAECAHRNGVEIARDTALLQAAFAGTELDANLETELRRGAQAIFPVKSEDLMPEFEGRALGARIEALRLAWIASGFTLTRDALLRLP